MTTLHLRCITRSRFRAAAAAATVTGQRLVALLGGAEDLACCHSLTVMARVAELELAVPLYRGLPSSVRLLGLAVRLPPANPCPPWPAACTTACSTLLPCAQCSLGEAHVLDGNARTGHAAGSLLERLADVESCRVRPCAVFGLEIKRHLQHERSERITAWFKSQQSCQERTRTRLTRQACLADTLTAVHI